MSQQGAAQSLPGIFPGARVTDSGQGAVFQYRREFVDAACDFLHR